MPSRMPSRCANAACREPSIRLIHHASRKVAIDAVEGAPVVSHHLTYRCSSCGHTWAVTDYRSEETPPPAVASFPANRVTTSDLRFE